MALLPKSAPRPPSPIRDSRDSPQAVRREMDRDFKAAAVSLECPGGRGDIVVDRIRAIARSLSARGVEAVCLPEACLTGYSLGEEAQGWAATLEAPVVTAVRDLARELGVFLLPGLMERGAQGQLHLSHLLCCPDGRMEVYRKTHLSPQEKQIFAAGSRPGLFRLGPLIAGVALCFECHFPEWIALLALRGAEVLFFPHASPNQSPEQKTARWLRYLPARAYDNSAFALACNQAGPYGKGLSFPAVALVLDPKGEILALDQGEREATAVATLEASLIARVRSHPTAYFLGHRRPELYQMAGPNWQSPHEGPNGATPLRRERQCEGVTRGRQSVEVQDTRK